MSSFDDPNEVLKLENASLNGWSEWYAIEFEPIPQICQTGQLEVAKVQSCFCESIKQGTEHLFADIYDSDVLGCGIGEQPSPNFESVD